MAQFDFDRIKEKVLATAGRGLDKSAEFCKTAGDKAKMVARLAKLRTEVAMGKDSLYKSFAELGKLYYESHKDKPAVGLMQAVAEVKLAAELVAAKEAEVAALKKVLADDIGEVVEDVKEKAEKAKDVAEDAAVKVKDTAKTASKKAKDTAKDASKKVKEAAAKTASKKVKDTAEKTEDAPKPPRKKPGPKPKPKPEAKAEEASKVEPKNPENQE